MSEVKMMWALVKEKADVGLWLKQVPIPECGKNDVKIKIRKTSICGTDVHIYNWSTPSLLVRLLVTNMLVK